MDIFEKKGSLRGISESGDGYYDDACRYNRYYGGRNVSGRATAGLTLGKL